MIVPLLLLSAMEFNGNNNNLGLIKKEGNSSNSNVSNTMSNQSSAATTAATPATTTNVTSHNNIAPFVTDIISLAKQNTIFRQEIKTANHSQEVLMVLKPGEDIGLEVHKKIDQLLIFVQRYWRNQHWWPKVSCKGRNTCLCSCGHSSQLRQYRKD